jgi:hypothetical protein
MPSEAVFFSFNVNTTSRMLIICDAGLQLIEILFVGCFQDSDRRNCDGQERSAQGFGSNGAHSREEYQDALGETCLSFHSPFAIPCLLFADPHLPFLLKKDSQFAKADHTTSVIWRWRLFDVTKSFGVRQEFLRYLTN